MKSSEAQAMSARVGKNRQIKESNLEVGTGIQTILPSLSALVSTKKTQIKVAKNPSRFLVTSFDR